MTKKPDINRRHVRMLEALALLEDAAVVLAERMTTQPKTYYARAARTALADAAMAYAATVRGLARKR